VRELVRGHYREASILSSMPMDVLELVVAQLAREHFSFSPG
jgi:hypothetical protein